MASHPRPARDNASRITVGSVTVGSRTFACSGWLLAGNAPVAGFGTNCVLTLTNNAVLTWVWHRSASHLRSPLDLRRYVDDLTAWGYGPREELADSVQYVRMRKECKKQQQKPKGGGKGGKKDKTSSVPAVKKRNSNGSPLEAEAAPAEDEDSADEDS
jgi:hypothetical protein